MTPERETPTETNPANRMNGEKSGLLEEYDRMLQ